MGDFDLEKDADEIVALFGYVDDETTGEDFLIEINEPNKIVELYLHRSSNTLAGITNESSIYFHNISTVKLIYNKS